MLELRPYQREALDALYSYWDRATGNPLIVLPTGTGKALVIAKLIQEAIGNWPGTRILVLTHTKELIRQDFDELLRIWPSAPVGVYSAGLRRRDTRSQVIFAGIQSIYKRAYELQRIDLVLIDEAHLVPETDNSQYRTLLAELSTINSHVKVIGLTATHFRLGQGLLTEGENAIFDGIAYEYGMLRAIEEGYLVPLVSKAMHTGFDMTGVGTRNGDYIQSQLEAAVDRHDVTAAAVGEIIACGVDRRLWLAFCSGVKHAASVRDEFQRRGVAAEMVCGEMPARERDGIIDAFKRGRIRALTNANLLTTGFNVPAVDLIAFLRPTKSAGLFVQMAGRGARCVGADIAASVVNGKPNCLCLDFARLVETHGPVDQIKPRRKGQAGDGGAPVKTCPACETIVFAGARVCPECGHEFPPLELKIDAVSSSAAILSSQIQPEWVPVTAVSYAKHEKPGRAPSLRVDYRCGIRLHREWVTLELSGFPREKACRWWSQRAGTRAPAKVDEALRRRHELRAPKEIAIRPSGKFVEIVGARFE